MSQLSLDAPQGQRCLSLLTSSIFENLFFFKIIFWTGTYFVNTQSMISEVMSKLRKVKRKPSSSDGSDRNSGTFLSNLLLLTVSHQVILWSLLVLSSELSFWLELKCTDLIFSNFQFSQYFTADILLRTENIS